jgi:hypothetical protein
MLHVRNGEVPQPVAALQTAEMSQIIRCKPVAVALQSNGSNERQTVEQQTQVDTSRRA